MNDLLWFGAGILVGLLTALVAVMYGRANTMNALAARFRVKLVRGETIETFVKRCVKAEQARVSFQEGPTIISPGQR